MQKITYPSILPECCISSFPSILIIFLQHKTAPIRPTYKLKKEKKKIYQQVYFCDKHIFSQDR